MKDAPKPPSRREFLRYLSSASLLLGGGWLSLPAGNASQLLQGRRKLGVVLVGLGSYATGQLGPALRETQLCRLAGVVTGDPAKGRRWAAEYDFPESSVYGYETMLEMADNPEIDIVYSVTPPSLHKRDTLRGFEAGKHVISEKPMAMNVGECDEMIAAAKAAGKQLAIGYRLHFHPYFRRVKEMAAQGGSGAFRELKGGFGGGTPDPDTWRMKKAMGGGPLMDLGIYVIYCATMAKNEEMPVAVTAEQPAPTRPDLFDEVEETLYFTLEWADGSTCEGETSFNRRANHYRASGDAGTVGMNPAYSYDGLRAGINGESLPKADGFNQQAHQLDGIARSILEERQSIVPGEMGRREMAVISAIFEAARTGERVEIG